MTFSAEQFFAALSSEVRLRSLILLQQEGELCVCELTYALGSSQPKVSRHLAHLREWGIVADRRDGLWIHYRLHPQLPGWCREVLRITTASLASQPPYANDFTTLQAMPNRPESACCT